MDDILTAWKKTIEYLDVDTNDILKEMIEYIKEGYEVKDIYNKLVYNYQIIINELLK